MKRITLVFIGIGFLINSLAFSQEIISWKDAHLYYGKNMTVEGIIVNTYNSGRACFLNFHSDYKKYFSAVIFSSDFSKFPRSPEDFYLNKRVHVSGIIKQYQGKPEIILKDSSQIKIIEKISKPRQLKEIRWEDADKHYGEYCYVRGKIVATFNSGKACFLNFHKNWKNYFTAVIFASDFNKFPFKPEEYYLNKEVKVLGVIKEYQGKPEIIVENPSQIEVIE